VNTEIGGCAMSALAQSFRALRDAGGVEPWDVDLLAPSASG
jgi:hypothetical protein